VSVFLQTDYIYSPTYGEVTLREVRHSLVLRDSNLSINMVKHVCVHKEIHLKSVLSVLESDRPQHDCPAASVIAQHYSSATFVSLRCLYHKEKF
jgi:hypothetical protein